MQALTFFAGATTAAGIAWMHVRCKQLQEYVKDHIQSVCVFDLTHNTLCAQLCIKSTGHMGVLIKDIKVDGRAPKTSLVDIEAVLEACDLFELPKYVIVDQANLADDSWHDLFLYNEYESLTAISVCEDSYSAMTYSERETWEKLRKTFVHHLKNVDIELSISMTKSGDTVSTVRW